MSPMCAHQTHTLLGVVIHMCMVVCKSLNSDQNEQKSFSIKHYFKFHISLNLQKARQGNNTIAVTIQFPRPISLKFETFSNEDRIFFIDIIEQ